MSFGMTRREPKPNQASWVDSRSGWRYRMIPTRWSDIAITDHTQGSYGHLHFSVLAVQGMQKQPTAPTRFPNGMTRGSSLPDSRRLRSDPQRSPLFDVSSAHAPVRQRLHQYRYRRAHRSQRYVPT